MRAFSRWAAGPVSVALVAIALVVLLPGTGSTAGPRIAKHDKVRVASGKWAGTVGAVRSVARGRYRVLLAGRATRHFRRTQLDKVPLAAGDRVRILGGRREGQAGRIERILSRRVARRFVVNLRRGPTRRLARMRLAFIPPRLRPPGGGGPIPPLGRPSCTARATEVATAAALRFELGAGRDVCVTAPVGDVTLDDLPSSTVRHVGTRASGSIGAIHLEASSGITFRARFRSIIIRRSNAITIEQSIVGGTRANRTLDQLIFIPERSDDVSIRDSEIGWTTADDSGNTGYGIRAYNHSARLHIVRNRLHNIGADAIQLGMDGPDTLVDRNEIAYVARPPESNEHSDDLQVVGNGPNMRITNNYMHDNGLMNAGGPATGGSGPYIHAGDTATMLFENNLVRDGRNFMQVGDLGTGGCSKSNLTFRRNTFVHNGTQFENAADLEWSLCGGSNNLYERNVVNDTFWIKHGFGPSGTTARDNLHGSAYRVDPATGACTVAACNPRGREPIGFRKPSGVHW